MNPSMPRIPSVVLPHFAIPLGLSGLAGAWTGGNVAVAAPVIIADILWTIAAAVWVLFVLLYAGQRIRLRSTFRTEFQHPVLGPLIAFPPMIGALIMTHFSQYMTGAAPWIVWFLVACSIVIAAQLLKEWIVGKVNIEQLQPAYFLPVVGAAFIASISFSYVYQREAAAAAFGVGIFFWVVIGTLITGRLITGGPVPDGLKPTLAILMVPPALGGLSWLFLVDNRHDYFGYALLGLLIMMALVQVLLIGEYRKLKVNVGFWTFTFPIGSATNFSVRWLGGGINFPGCTALVWVLLGLASTFVVAIALATLIAPRLVKQSVGS